MNSLSIKSRLVLLHTLMMTLIVVFVLGLLFSMSSSEAMAHIQEELIDRVIEGSDLITLDNNDFDFDSDFIDIKDGIYLSAYNYDSHELIYGRMPYGFIYDLAFKEGVVQTVDSGNTTYLVYDLDVILNDNHLLIRGIVSTSSIQNEYSNSLRIAVILLPLLIILTAISGYLLSKRAMMPVEKITSTVNDIRNSRDLSKRVELGKGKDEIYKLANTFDDLLEDIEKGIKREKQFTSDVAHELRTPLTVIRMSIDDLLDNELDEDIKEDLLIIKKKNDLMTKMVAELLLLSRADQGRININKEVINLSELAKTISLEFKDIAKENKRNLNYEIFDDVYIMADETLIIRLFDNVLENAIKYTNVNGNIDIRVYKEDRVYIKVSDDGIGINKEDQEKIFDRFYKVDSSRHDNSSGLGLSLVKWIVEVHGGEIIVESEINEGTCFTFILDSL